MNINQAINDAFTAYTCVAIWPGENHINNVIEFYNTQLIKAETRLNRYSICVTIKRYLQFIYDNMPDYQLANEYLFDDNKSNISDIIQTLHTSPYSMLPKFVGNDFSIELQQRISARYKAVLERLL